MPKRKRITISLVIFDNQITANLPKEPSQKKTIPPQWGEQKEWGDEKVVTCQVHTKQSEADLVSNWRNLENQNPPNPSWSKWRNTKKNRKSNFAKTGEADKCTNWRRDH